MSKFRKLLDWVERIVHILSTLGAVAAGFVIFALVLIITVYVFVRASGRSWLFVEEWGGYLLILVTYVGAAYALRKGAHIQMKLVLDNVSVKARMLLSAFFSLVSIALMGFLTYLSTTRVIDNIKQGTRSLHTSETPLWIPNIFIPIGLGLLTLAVVFYFIHALMNLVTKVPEKDKEESTTGVNLRSSQENGTSPLA